MPAAVRVRAVEEADPGAIAAIYSHYVAQTAITFDLEAPSVEHWREKWRGAQRSGHPWRLALEHERVVGYAVASEFRPKAAYRSTIETTIYLDPGAVGRGVGHTLYADLLGDAASSFHLAVAGVTLPNSASVALHERLGFRSVGVFEQVGHKLGSWHDVGWWQLPLATDPPRPPT